MGRNPVRAPILTPARYYEHSGTTDERHETNVLRPIQPDEKPPAFTLDQLKGMTFLIDEEDGTTMRGSGVIYYEGQGWDTSRYYRDW